MTMTVSRMRALWLGTALAALGACTTSEMDWDLRSRAGSLNTADAARQATAERPRADDRGVLSYPGYQVALARQGDTVASLSARVGLDAAEVARHNALGVGDPLRGGEVLALPRRVAEPPRGTAGAIYGSPITTDRIDVTSIASGAIDRASGSSSSSSAPAGWQTGPQPVAAARAEPARHKVARGETAYSIARTYNVSARSLADWNGLGPDLAVREGQFLMIPTALPGEARPTASVTPPGAGSPTPEPPSAAKPLPAEKTAAAAAPTPGTPASPDLGASRTAASAARFAMPVEGKIIRGYVQKKNDGIDIAAAPGTPVKAAADGTVAAITKDTDQVPILVLRHADNLLTVYAGIDGIKVAKGATIQRGQTLAVIRAANPAFLHFEVRKGFDSVDPMPYLQ
ncbi:LysM peptidoglycan-binding domain-containing M23 family metallopeptidase [Paracoccaceae bacterium Fryx2]|nr:LysM peptidoglycan-binding domain-containing M23 family metallopeptidase [Paracoccaceae bacterium Fryx2]